MKELFDRVTTMAFNRGFVYGKTEKQLESPEDVTCATMKPTCYVGEFNTKANTYGVILNGERTRLTLVDNEGDFIQETNITDGTFYLGNKPWKLVPTVDHDIVYFKIEHDPEAKHAPTMSKALVSKALAS